MSEPRYQIPPAMNHLRTELETYYRVLPRLLEEEEDGRHVVIRGTELYGTWDSFRDAVQYGLEKFGDRNFLAQEVDPRMQQWLAHVFGPVPAAVAS